MSAASERCVKCDWKPTIGDSVLSRHVELSHRSVREALASIRHEGCTCPRIHPHHFAAILALFRSLGYVRIDPDDEALVEKVARAAHIAWREAPKLRNGDIMSPWRAAARAAIAVINGGAQ